MIEITDTLPTPKEYVTLRERAGLSVKSIEAAQKGLPNSLFAVYLRTQGKLIGMGRVIGDGACFFQIVDIAVDPDYQGQGLGKTIMARIDTWLEAQALSGSYVSLIADEPEFYAKLGYQLTSPDAQGMYRRLTPKS
ncbi:hypothetical protein Xmau_00355 [Xenorhabdus mauleonii]|uniref:Acetyltransferase (GNAT) domain-containing protein n=1 Tax=Xenorhabdus mauleonii TaxID=351675 RepID=A0A1I3UA07_9GAMM|nr:GNAT family N-acetyltransferase [Xenorhabdus mauleonii]PHM45963.1 hypothetical protein Xmau_00355 [Xenorhabdus mauleonii]SFJ79752.1 Acetyltransferase (GNAT) domain-containing protein [Xenorhabdus mauleonii]